MLCQPLIDSKGITTLQRHDNRCTFGILLDNLLDNFPAKAGLSDRRNHSAIFSD
jgi:hypothetical protein